MAERVGFEPTVGCPTLAFQASTFVHSVISPKMVREGGIEPPLLKEPDPKSGASTNSATLA